MRSAAISSFLLALVTLAAACSEDASKPPTSPTPTCAFSISIDATSFGPGGGTATATVGTSAGCAWSAAVEADWVTIDSASNRTGEGTLPVTIKAFDGSSDRAATLIIAQQSFRLTQNGCLIRLSESELSFTGDADARDVRVETEAGCRWAVEGDLSWSSLEPPSGTGAAVTRVRANHNQSTAPRTAELRLGGQPLRLRQAGGGEPPTPPQPPRGAVCSYSVTPVEAYVASRGGTGTVTVSAPPECTWTATSALPHARILRGASGSGPGVIEFEVESNPVVYVVDFRKVAIEVRWPTPTAGQNVWLSQFGDCGGAGSVQNYTVPADGGRIDQNVLVESPFNCPWRVEGGANWLSSVFPQTGRINRGDGNLHVVVGPNTTGQPRSTTLLVAERIYVITQLGR